MAGKISELDAADALTGAELVELVQSAANVQSDVDALKAYALDGLAIADVDGLETALSGKAASSHTHTASEVTDFSEAVDDRVNALLVAGSNVTLTYNDASNTLTVAAAGGSGSPGGSDTYVQYNDGSAFGGDAGFTYNETNKSIAVGGATVTTAAVLGAFTQTWNGSGQSFHGISVDITTTAYDSGTSTAIRVRQGTTTKAGIKPTGEIFSVNEVKVASGGASGQASVIMMDGRIATNSSSYFGITNSTSAASTPDTAWYRDAAGFWGARSASSPTSPCGISAYGTYTSSTNYERVTLTAGSAYHKLSAEKGSSGTLRPLVMSYHSMSGAPTATEVPDGHFGVFMDTADSNAIRIWANKSGTLVSATLA